MPSNSFSPTIIKLLFCCLIAGCSPSSTRSRVIQNAPDDTLQSNTIITEESEEGVGEDVQDIEEEYSLEDLSDDDPFDTLLRAGKQEFYKNFDEQNYSFAVENLEKAVNLQPNNAEARYFLGYAYSRLNTKDGKDMNKSALELTLKSSGEFEKVIELTPEYTGDVLVLDPYSKLTAEWGSLAMTYLSEKKSDSASWAFKEGKKRGGFGEFFLSLNRAALDNCPKNTILISNGDNFTIPLWYLQVMEKYRTDVTVIDINLLNTVWYPRYLKSSAGIFSNLASSVLDTIVMCSWTDSVITVKCADNTVFSWNAKTSEGETRFYRSDLLLLRLIEENRFKRNIFFTMSFPEYARLNLSDKLKKYTVIDRLNYDNSPQLDSNSFNTVLARVSTCFEHINKNSQQESNVPDQVRWEVVDLVKRYVQNNRDDYALNALQTLNKLIDANRFPYKDSRFRLYIETLNRQLSEKKK